MRKSACVSAIALLAALLLAAPAFGEDAATHADKPKNKKADAHVISTSPSYLGLDPIYTTILDGDTATGMLMIGVGIDVPDENLRATALKLMPVIRDLYVRYLLDYTALNVRPWRQPNVAEIADRMQQITDAALQRKGAHLLVAQIAIRLNK